jgi:hypothetical protein
MNKTAFLGENMISAINSLKIIGVEAFQFHSIKMQIPCFEKAEK